MTKNKKTFTPNQLQNITPLQGFMLLSANYFKVANELRIRSHATSDGKYHVSLYTLPSVIMYITAFESYLSENLAGLVHHSDTLLEQETISSLLYQNAPFNNFKNWVKETFRILDSSQNGIDTNSSVYQNLIALHNLRNMIVHYTPQNIDHNKWPIKLQDIIRRIEINPFNSGWESNLSTTFVADWAYGTTRDAITYFYQITGHGMDVFNCDKPFRWE